MGLDFFCYTLFKDEDIFFLCNFVNWPFNRWRWNILLSSIKAPWVRLFKDDKSWVCARYSSCQHAQRPRRFFCGISRNAHRLSLHWWTHTKKWTKQPTSFFYCHCAWTLTLQVTQGVSCSELMNTLTCQWCALVTLSAGFVSVDGFSNKLLDDPAPMLKTKGMKDETLVSKNGQHPGGQYLFFPIIAHI